MKILTLRILLLFFFVIAFYAPARSQSDSCNLQISLLTCTPGEDLYSTFGHSALRVIDRVSNTDIVYNYGTFNFEEEDFYIKFTRGKLLYYLSTEPFESFAYAYAYEHRGITEQVLNLTCEEEYNLLLLLKTNLLDANRFYKYDFTFDNCTTRLRDIVEKAAISKITYGNVLNDTSSYRDLIHEYLNRNDKQWSKLGIDLLLGRRLDRSINARKSMFLPDYLMNTFAISRKGAEPLVANKNIVVKGDDLPPAHDYLADPVIIFTFLLLLVIIGSFSQNSFVRNILLALDGFLYFVTGFLGLLIVFMWTGTEHYMCKDNFNLLWAWPTNIVMAFFVHSAKKSSKIYFLAYSIFCLLLLTAWFFLPQDMNPSFVPIIAIIVFRTMFFYLRKSV